jgi:hypothetical protein
MNIDGLCSTCGFGPPSFSDWELFALFILTNLALAAIVLTLLRLMAWMEERR